MTTFVRRPFLDFARGLALALLGGLVKASTLLVVRVLGAMCGLAQGLTRMLPVFVPDDRSLPCKNTETMASLEPLTDVPDAYFFRTTSRHGFDVRELAQCTLSKPVWQSPLTQQPLSDVDVARLQVILFQGARTVVRAFLCGVYGDTAHA